jgi:hypothetical protein
MKIFQTHLAIFQFLLMKLKNNIITLLLYIIVSMVIFNACIYDSISCEEIIEYESLKQAIIYELTLYVKQEEFISLFKSRFYFEVILNNTFVETFVNSLNLQELLHKHAFDPINIKSKILYKFLFYVNYEQIKYEQKFLNDFIFASITNIIPFIESCINYKAHLPNTDGSIITKGAYSLHKSFAENAFQNYIKNGFYLELSLDDGLFITVSWYNFVIVKKRIL